MANEFIQCRKVCEHVLEKVLNAETTPSAGNANNSLQNSQSDANSEGSQLPAEERIELWCNDVVSSGTVDKWAYAHVNSLFFFVYRSLIRIWICVLCVILYGSNRLI